MSKAVKPLLKNIGSTNLSKRVQIPFITGWMGTGKTTDKMEEVIDYLSKNMKGIVVFIFDNHELIEEQIERFERLAKYSGTPLNIRHLKGMKQEGMCLEPKYLKLYEKLPNTRIICGRICKRTDCMYQQLFNFTGINLFVLPKEYLNTQIMTKINPDLIFFDDINNRAKNDYSSFTEANSMYLFWKRMIDPNHDTGIDKDSLDQVIFHTNTIINRVDELVSSFLADLYDDSGQLIQAKNPFGLADYSIPLQLDKHNFIGWKKYRLRNRKREIFSRPFYFDIFDYATKNNKINIIGTLTPWGKYHLKLLSTRYREETGIDVISKYEEKTFPKNYKFGEIIGWLSHHNINAQWCKQSLRDENIKKSLKSRIDQAMKDEYRAGNIPELSKVRIGIVIVKEFGDNKKELIIDFIPSYIKSSNVLVVTYGKERGTNKLVNTDIVFVLGTYLPRLSALAEESNRLYGTNYPIKQDELVKRKFIIKNEEKGWCFDSKLAPELENLRLMSVNDTLIQAIGRGAFRGKPSYIFAGIDPAIGNLFEKELGMIIHYQKDEQPKWLLNKQKNRLKFNDEITGLLGCNPMRMIDVHKKLLDLQAQGKTNGIIITKNRSRFRDYVKECASMFQEFDIFTCKSSSHNKKRKGGRKGLCLRRNY